MTIGDISKRQPDVKIDKTDFIFPCMCFSVSLCQIITIGFDHFLENVVNIITLAMKCDSSYDMFACMFQMITDLDAFFVFVMEEGWFIKYAKVKSISSYIFFD